MNGSFELEINENIARITSKIDNEILTTWKINKQDIIDAINFKENLIKYLEDNIEVLNNQSESVEGLDLFEQHSLIIYQDILERVKSGDYE